MLLLFNNGMSGKKSKNQLEVKDTEKLYFQHKVPLLNMSTGQESFPIPPQSSGVKGREGTDSWALLALLLTGIGMGQVTNGLVLLSEVGVINAAPREHSRSELPLSVSAAFCTSSWELRKAAWVGDESRITVIIAKCF